MNPALTVFFDGACPLCQREIAYYQRLDTAQRVAWVDVSGTDAACPDGYCQQDLLKRFHVRTPEGRWLSGAAGFAHLWLHLPGVWRYLGRVASWGPITWVLERAYRAFLPVRPWLQRRARASAG